MKSLIRNSFLAFFLMLWVFSSAARAQEQGQAASGYSMPIDAPAAANGGPQKDYSPFPQPDAGYVTDLANLLTIAQEEEIERWLWQADSRSKIEIIVVTINSPADYGGPKSISDIFSEQLHEKYGAAYPGRFSEFANIEQFARGLFDKYGIGNMPANDGVLLLVSVKDRKARIELGAGYGRVRDADARRIMDDEIVPSFREDDYAGGIRNGVKAILLEFAGLRVGPNWPLIIVASAIPVVGLIAVSLFRKGKKGWGWVCVGILIVLILALLSILVRTVRHMPKGRSRGWSAGGIGGFGGGFSGGGGATGSW